MATQVKMEGASRAEIGKGATGRLRKTGRTPAIVYGRGIEPTSVHVDALELYHALHTEAGLNVLVRLEVEGEEHLTIVREIQRHPVRGDVMHVDFQAVDRNQLIPAEIPVRLHNEDSPRETGGVVNLILHTVPIHVTPLEVPSEFELDLDGMTVGDVLRVEDLAGQLPEGATFDIEEDRTVVTINAPMAEIVESEDEGEEGLAEGEEAAEAEGGEDASGDAAEGDADEE
jgi:large subunit ribosomal protein L25